VTATVPKPVPETPTDSLRDRVFLVTGSGRGLGAAVARAAAAAGASVALNCRSEHRGAEILAAEIAAGGGRAIACRADVTEPGSARQLVDETVRVFGRVDVLVNTVGAFTWKPLCEVEPAEWRAVFASNLDSVYHLCRFVLPHMRRQHWGRIVNLGAVGAESSSGEPQRAAYAAAKSAVVALSRSLALEEARCGITVNVVSPGLIEDDGEGPAPSALEGRVPVGHAGRLDDVVRAVLFFASPAAGFVTGQVLAVAGGARQ
jgi:NAD(P)-dependent dehydrogenase (short-subunit alcohol dehydrogenase family)